VPAPLLAAGTPQNGSYKCTNDRYNKAPGSRVKLRSALHDLQHSGNTNAALTGTTHSTNMQPTRTHIQTVKKERSQSLLSRLLPRS